MLNANLDELLQQVPGPDNQSLSSPAEVEKLDRVVEALFAGGPAAIGQCIARLAPAADETARAKAGFILHIMAVRVGGGQGDERRRALTSAIASALADKETDASVKKYLVRELQVFGDAEAASALGALLAHDDAELADTAAQALVAIGAGAGEQLRAALPKTKGPNRLIVVQNLGVLRDRESAAALRELLGDESQDFRLAAAWALANIGDASSADSLIKLAEVEQGYARAKAHQACLLLAERLIVSRDRNTAAKIYSQLQKSPEAHVREAATIGLNLSQE